ncbi:MAG: hypothetical protein ACRDQA_24945, partial [Nocardioidaceae bacterium]
TVGGVAVAAPKATPKHETGNAGELWAWSEGGRNLLALVVAKRHTNVPTQTGVEGSLLTQVEQAKGDLDKPDVSQLDVDVPGAKGSAGTALQGSSKGVPVHQALVMFTDGDQTMYLVRLSVLRTKAGNALADQIVHSLTLAG